MNRAVLAIVFTLVACRGDERAIDFEGGPVAGWAEYGGDPGGARHSPLNQITPENVALLEVAWTHRHGDVSDGSDGRGATAFEATPILLGDTLYYCTPMNRIFAVDAETGVERWVYDPGVDRGSWIRTCRGLAHFVDASRAAAESCRTRLYMGTMDARLVSVDAADGTPCADFGESGAVDLTVGVGEIRPGEYAVTSPPTVIGEVVAVGALVGDSGRVDAPSGVIRGFDVRTGELRWAFDTAPPGSGGEFARAADSGFALASPNAWSILSADPERDLLFVPTGNPSNDFYGGLRNGIDHYGSAVVALRGRTGEVVWSFQTVHHDLWDYDVAAQPTLLDVQRDGRSIPAVAQATKSGVVFLLDRETGRPIYPVEERPVPAGDVPGEVYSPTQPFPTFPEPIHPFALTPEDAFGLTPWDRGKCRELLARHRNQGIFTPPSFEGSIQYPGVAGGVNWGGVAVDPDRQILVTNVNRIAVVERTVPRDDPNAFRREGKFAGVLSQEGTPYVNQQTVLVSPLGIPCSPPPWGSLLALDLQSGDILWEIPFGTTRGQAPFPFWFDWGLPSMGGPIVTASGLVFIGAAIDGYLRAYDVSTGEELWREHLPAGGQATPMTYRLRPNGRQFLVIAAGGHGKLGTELGDAVIAFALPATK